MESMASPPATWWTKKRLTILALVLLGLLVLFLTTTIVIAVVLSSSSSPKSSGSGLSPSSPEAEGLLLPPFAGPGELHTLTLDECGNCTVARSYDGYPWEPTPRNDRVPVTIVCGASECRMLNNVSGVHVKPVEVHPQVAARATSPGLAATARLLWQATFGASLGEIEATHAQYGDDVGAWVMDQMGAPRTSVRAYLRQRANNRVLLSGANEQAETTTRCDQGSRWTRGVFSLMDEQKTLKITTGDAPGRYSLYIDDALRAEVGSFWNITHPEGGDAEYVIQCVRHGTNGAVRLAPVGTAWRSCSRATDFKDEFSFVNPVLDFGDAGSRLPGAAVETLSGTEVHLSPVAIPQTGVVIMTSRTSACTPGEDAKGNAFMRVDGVWYRHDKRAKYVLNTPESPSTVDQATDSCPLSPINYQNEEGCRLRPACGGALPVFANPFFVLDGPALRGWYESVDESRLVYETRGLRLEGPYAVSPCSGSRSRWVKIGVSGSCSETAGVDGTTRATIASKLADGGTDKSNANLRDIILLASPSCDETNAATVGAVVAADGGCWQHVHPDEYSVRDYTEWNENHDGNVGAANNGNPFPVGAVGASGLVSLWFPASHPMNRWKRREAFFPVVGRMGDSIAFRSLPFQLQTVAFALRVGALSEAPSGGAMACGSLDEVANVPVLGEHYPFRGVTYLSDASVDTASDDNDVTENVLNNVMHKAGDQLRQRVAWTLSNIMVLSTATLGNLVRRPEGFLHYYDGFTRHAFGSMFDVLKHVSYNRFMGSYLTYLGSRSYSESGSFPDENYAREVMQLFSIGLVELGDDGVPVLDENGVVIPTYTQEDIVDYARAWTGFEAASGRTNAGDEPTTNGFDPMRINARYRDVMPKLGLGPNGGYLGDTYPDCSTLPEHPWLMKGARFRFVGTESGEGSFASAEEKYGRVELASDGTSPLFEALCARPGLDKMCTFPAGVTLKESLECGVPGEGECGGMDSLVSVKIVDPINNATYFYRHRGVPCVRLSLFGEGRIIRRSTKLVCANPDEAVALPVCCASDRLDRGVNDVPGLCKEANERVRYATNEARCASEGLVMCDPLTSYGSLDWTCLAGAPRWSSTACRVKVQVYPSGAVGVVDPAAPSDEPLFAETSNNFFRVRWGEGGPVKALNGECPGGCSVAPTSEGDSCVCEVGVVEGTVFGNVSEVWGMSREEVVREGGVGSIDPRLYGGGFRLCEDGLCAPLVEAGIEVWLKEGEGSGDGGVLGMGTVFGVGARRVGGRARWVTNRRSTVVVGTATGSAGAGRFRNPPVFGRFVGWANIGLGADPGLAEVGAYDETDALLEHLVEHDSTGPFICWRLAQQLVTSNPSPRYMKAIVGAFRSGVAPGAGNTSVTFSGRYGDLGAAVYTLLTDREARNGVLTADPSFGMINDPFISLHRVLRGLEYVSHSGKELILSTVGKIGVGPMQAPTVFNFYLPENQPPGALLEQGLYAPAGQLATAPVLVSFFNGLHSLVEHGLSSCDSGFGDGGSGVWRRESGCSGGRGALYSDGNLTYFDRAVSRWGGSGSGVGVVDELGLVLTGGRLHEGMETHEVLVEEFERVVGSGVMGALKHVVKALVTSPEFNTATPEVGGGEKREDVEEGGGEGRALKSVVYLFLSGGADTFAMLAPGSVCDAGVRANYDLVRTIASLPIAGSLPITNGAGGHLQPCSEFVMHPGMTNLHQMYLDEDALWVANVGPLAEPTSKEAYLDGGVRLPVSLYAHNQQQVHAMTVKPENVFASGVMGRLAEELASVGGGGYKTVLQSVSGATRALGGTKLRYDIVGSGSGGVEKLREIGESAAMGKELGGALDRLLGKRMASPFNDYFGENLVSAINFTETLSKDLESVTLLNADWSSDTSSGTRQLKRIAELMVAGRGKQVERGVFWATVGGFDTHNSVDLGELVTSFDLPMGLFAKELKDQGLWEDTVVVIASEFGRRLVSNGQGTDHAWGGNAIVVGGGVKGGRVLGQYLDAFDDAGSQMLSKGRAIPTTPWDFVWSGIAEWMGVGGGGVERVVPGVVEWLGGGWGGGEMFE